MTDRNVLAKRKHLRREIERLKLIYQGSKQDEAMIEYELEAIEERNKATGRDESKTTLTD